MNKIRGVRAKMSTKGVYQCSYCFRLSDDIRLAVLRSNKEWQKQRYGLCPDCREYLNGQFKYV